MPDRQPWRQGSFCRQLALHSTLPPHTLEEHLKDRVEEGQPDSWQGQSAPLRFPARQRASRGGLRRIHCTTARPCTSYSFSKPWFVNFRVRLFSVTVRTTLSG